MDIEFETKVLNIDADRVIDQLRKLNAREFPEELMRRYVFDYDTEHVEFLRLRESKGMSTLAYKYKSSGNVEVGQTQEIEVVVSDFDKTAAILKKLVFKRVFYQENKRHLFVLNAVEFSIDTWPKLNPLLEIEAKDKEKLRSGLLLLNLEGKDVGDKDIKTIYQENGIDVHAFPELRF